MTEPLDRPMNDTRFETLLGADPLSQDPEFLAAAQETPERRAAWEGARAFETRLRSTLEGVTPPTHLEEKLLALPASVPVTAVPLERARGREWARRLLPAAALLLLALGINSYLRIDAAWALQQDLFGHIYAEEPYITARRIQLDEVNMHLEASLGAHLDENTSTEKLEVTFVKDCRVAKRVGTHLVVKGKQGPVNVIMLSDALVEGEQPISDDKLSGKIAPSGGTHTLVVIGDEQEPIDEYLRVLDSNIKWEY